MYKSENQNADKTLKIKYFLMNLQEKMSKFSITLPQTLTRMIIKR